MFWKKSRFEPLTDEEVAAIEPEYFELPQLTEEELLQSVERIKENARRGIWLDEGLSEGQFMLAMEREPGLGALKPGEDYDRVRKRCIRQQKRMFRRIERRLRRAERWLHWKRAVREMPVCRFFKHML